MVGFALVVIFAALCALGGQGIKQFRRFVAPAIFGGGICFLAYLKNELGLLVALGSGWYCPSLLLFKYGVNDGNVWKKILLRGLYGGSLGLGGLLIGLGLGHPWLGSIQLVLASASCITFGVVNPFPNSWGNLATVVEDLFIYGLAVILIPFMFLN